MRKILITIAILILTFLQDANAQDSTSKASPQLTKLFTAFQGIKEALAVGNADKVAAAANTFIKAANGIDYKIISEGNIHSMLKDAGAISTMTQINMQQQRFDLLSANMSIIAKALNITIRP